MAGKTLEEYFVSLGIKGQNVVLKNIKDIKKAAADLSKGKTSVNLKGKGGVSGNNIIPPSPTPWEQKEEKTQKENNNKFSKGIKTFADSARTMKSSVESFDPVGAVKGLITASGEALSNITIAGFGVGNLPKGLAEFANTMVSMSAGAIEMAKNSSATQYALSNRNATTRYYGGEGIGQGGMSRAQHSELVMAISGSFGRIQKPFQDTVNKLVESKNTEALARVAGGNWASTGTDKGWFLQQIANETQGLPPSIAQAIQNSLLKSNADLIQDKGAEAGPQGKNADWMNLQEEQNAEIYKTTAAQHDKLISLSGDLNKMQVQMINTGVGFAGAIVDATEAIRKLPEKIEKANKAFDSMAEKIYKYSLHEVDIRRMSK